MKLEIVHSISDSISNMDAFLTKKSQDSISKSKLIKTSSAVLLKSSGTQELTSDDPNVSAFYGQLSDRERIAHKIAIEKLGTSYDVTRTHGYVKWNKSRN